MRYSAVPFIGTVKLDENGEASITFYNNSRQTTLNIEAEGQAADGTLLWGKWRLPYSLILNP